jgi:hypothetical protein
MSILGNQIAATLCPGMHLPAPLEQLFRWIENAGFFLDQGPARLGYLHGGNEKLRCSPGTSIAFVAEGNVNMKYWFGTDAAKVIDRLCVFAHTGSDGSMAAFWLDDDGEQKIVHLGSGSGSTLVCMLADSAVDFLRLLAIGYEEICWGEFSEPAPGRDIQLAQWVEHTFAVTIPSRGSEIVRHPARMEDSASPDPFWRWTKTCLEDGPG